MIIARIAKKNKGRCVKPVLSKKNLEMMRYRRNDQSQKKCDDTPCAKKMHWPFSIFANKQNRSKIKGSIYKPTHPKF